MTSPPTSAAAGTLGVRERAADGATAPVGLEHHQVGRWLLVRLRRPPFALTRKPVAEDLYSNIPGSKPVVIPGVGHLSKAIARLREPRVCRQLSRRPREAAVGLGNVGQKSCQL